MNIGIIAAIAATIFGGVLSMYQKKISVQYSDNFLALVYQYISVAIRALVFVGVFSRIDNVPLIPVMSPTMRLLAVGVSIIGYLGIAFLYKAFDHLPAGVALVIANMSVFLMYFINVSLFEGSESLSLISVIIAVVFFIVVSQFLIGQKTDVNKKTKIINIGSLYAIGTALCRTIFYVGNNYFIKTGTMDPSHAMFVTECLICIVALIRYIASRKNAISTIHRTISKKDIIIFTVIGFANAAMALLLYYGYQSNPANIINFIKLFYIITTAVLCRIFLKDYLTRKQVVLLILSVILLVLFLWV